MSTVVVGTRTIELVHIHCGGCGVDYGLDRRVWQDRKDTGNTFYCPNGCQRSYHETTADKLREQLEREKKNTAYWQNRMAEEREYKEKAQRSAAAHRGQVTKIKNRVSAGVCPCCRRNFANLAAHMKTKHPDWSQRDV